jgi:hypothetical protein
MSPHTITIGLTESKLVIDVLSEAYDEAKRSGYPKVEVKLSNAKVSSRTFNMLVRANI